ncbi:Fc.00g046150.m01.CDS01 [Cosmosporella sp. VM-42]
MPTPPSAVATGSASVSEKNATASASAMKQRSCVVCRSRKVRCDKQTPCSNCRRANIECVVPSNDRPPKWARRLERITNNAASPAKVPEEPGPGVGQVMERLRNLEGLVKELSSQLEQANAAASSAAGGSSGLNSPGNSSQERDADHQTGTTSTASTTGMQKHFGRLVLKDSSRSRYVGSGFWSRVSDELDGLKMDTRGLASGDSDTSEEEDSPGRTSSTQELERTPSERHAFLFGHNLGASMPDLRDFRPLPSQIPFLLDIFSENLNFFLQIIHMPTVTQMIRETRGSGMSNLTPANEALMFSIYYAAVTSLEEDDVMANFGSTKAALNMKYRLGFEYAMAKADFLNVPDLVLVQAFAIFLFLVRRHDSPRFVWMMTGLVIRMGQAIGLHRDGSHFEHLPPYEVELRRRVWWALCMLDVRASEDQGTDFTIASGSFDTKLPSNINDADISPETKETPQEHDTLTDSSFALASYEIVDVTRQMMAPGVKDGGPSLEEQSRLLDNLYQVLERGYLQYSTDPGNIACWVGITATRLVISKLTLFIYLPALFSSPGDHLSEEIRSKLLIAAIEVAEYNHMLNSEEKCRQWRWTYQTYTHWHAIVYLLIESCRRQWSPIVERAWIALHSRWLIPGQLNMDKNLRIWVPLRKLMAKARKHREAELNRLRGDAPTIEQLEMGDRKIPVPASSGPFPSGNSEELFREHWRSLVIMPAKSDSRQRSSGTSEIGVADSLIEVQRVGTPQKNPGSNLASEQHVAWTNTDFGASSNLNPTMATELQTGLVSRPTDEVTYTTPSGVPTDWLGGPSIGPDFAPWLWADADPAANVFADMDVNMDVDGDVNWNTWLESATGMGWTARPDAAHGSWPTPTSRASRS